MTLIALRTRRYIGPDLVDEKLLPAIDLTAEVDEEAFAPFFALVEQHGEWSALCSNEGLPWREVIDDANSDIELITFDDALMRAGPMTFLTRLQTGMRQLIDHYEGRR